MSAKAKGEPLKAADGAHRRPGRVKPAEHAHGLAVMRQLATYGTLTSRDLAGELGLTTNAVYNLLGRLAGKGVVQRLERRVRGRRWNGAPQTPVKVSWMLTPAGVELVADSGGER